MAINDTVKVKTVNVFLMDFSLIVGALTSDSPGRPNVEGTSPPVVWAGTGPAQFVYALST